MIETVLGITIVFSILAALLGLPFLLCKLTEIELQKDHWWHALHEVMAGYGSTSIRFYGKACVLIPVVIFGYIADGIDLSKQEEQQTLALVVLCLLLVLTNKRLIALHREFKRVMLSSFLYGGFLTLTTLLYLAGSLERDFIRISWPVISIFWGLHLFGTEVWVQVQMQLKRT